MTYLLTMVLPGAGQIAGGRALRGLFFIILWVVGITAAMLAIAVDVAALVAGPSFHVALVAIACWDVQRLRRKQSLSGPRLVLGCGLLPLGPLLAAGLAFAVYAQGVRPLVIRSGSMLPGIGTGHVVVARLFLPFVPAIGRGEIVLVRHPSTRGRLLIKRVLGLAGDLVQVRSGEIWLNGRPLSQCVLRTLRDPETNRQVVERLEVVDRRPYLVWDLPAVVSRPMSTRVPAGHVFVVGDNRDRSGDSRTFGTVRGEAIFGRIRVGLVPWPENSVDRAPEGARKAAFRRCSRPRRSQKSSTSTSEPGGTTGRSGTWTDPRR